MYDGMGVSRDSIFFGSETERSVSPTFVTALKITEGVDFLIGSETDGRSLLLGTSPAEASAAARSAMELIYARDHFIRREDQIICTEYMEYSL